MIHVLLSPKSASLSMGARDRQRSEDLQILTRLNQRRNLPLQGNRV